MDNKTVARLILVFPKAIMKQIVWNNDLTNPLAADKWIGMAAQIVVPHQRICPLMQAIFITSVVWLTGRPECVVPGGAVRPLPSALFLYVVASNPNGSKVLSFHCLCDVVFYGTWGHRGQMTTLSLTELFSICPGLLLSAPEVAVVSVPLPTLSALFHAFVSAASKRIWSWRFLLAKNACRYRLMTICNYSSDMEFVQKFTPPDFQAKNFTPSISPNFNSFSGKKHKKWVKMEKFTPLAKILHWNRQWRHGQIPPLCTV